MKPIYQRLYRRGNDEMSRLFQAALMMTVLVGICIDVRADDKDAKKKAPKAKAVKAEKPAPPLFADKNLEAVIRQILKKKGKDEIKAADLKDIFFLEASSQKIADLSGLEKCINLAEIQLDGNAISDVGPLSGLKNVQLLDLSKNKIIDITPLAGLLKLQYLKLDANRIEKVKALKDLKALRTLFLSKNKIKSLAPLSGLAKLWSLYLAENQVVDISPLKGLKWLKSLDLTSNAVVDLSPLSGLTELQYTMLQKNKITNIAPLVSMAKKDSEGEKRFAPYWNVYLAGNPLSSATRKQQLAELKKYVKQVELK